MNFLTKSLCFLMLIGTLGLTACDNDGPLEEAGESIDEAAEDVEDAVD